MICSQLPVTKWYAYLTKPTLEDVILDRIIPMAHRIEFEGKNGKAYFQDHFLSYLYTKG